MGLPPALLLALCLCPACPSLAPPDPGLLAQGRARLREAQVQAQHPTKLGACWAGALGRLQTGCQQLGEEQQSRIALAFAHCHLQRSGRPFPRCEAGSSVRACTQHMDPVAFGVYTEFFTHAHSICYLLRSEAWQQRAESAVDRLVASSEGVAERLEETNQLAEQAARAQEAALRSQEEILRHGELLRETLQDSSRGVREAFQDMQESAGRQRLAFAEMVNRLSFLHRFLVGESQALGTFLYHLLTSSAALLLTSSQRTAGARLVLLALVGVNIYLERVVSGLVLENPEASYDPTEALARWVGLCRRLCAGTGLAVLAYAALTYRDVAQQSREVLRGLQETRAQMQHILQETGAERKSCSPRRRSRSRSRSRSRLQRSTGRLDSETLDVPVPLDGLCRYELQRRPSPETPPDTRRGHGAPQQRPRGKTSDAGGRGPPAESTLASDTCSTNAPPRREPGRRGSLRGSGGRGGLRARTPGFSARSLRGSE
ncbi:uncharacterized protein [Emydura macquarii macquarii]|uniref:uncharacterized protein isoform X2 n=1 Tax=Emydura macquarii macquarii TaxID=1129001 RepID=UPI00352AC96B